jgi:hypothetical protein
VPWGGPSFALSVRDGSGALWTEAIAGLGRVVALHHRASASHQIHEHIWCLFF